MHDDTSFTEFVTFTIVGQTFGLPIACVQDVFKPARITRVPLAGAEIAGVLNLRGRIVTAIDMRRRLDVREREEGDAPMAIGIEAKGESFGLLVDAVGEVLKLPARGSASGRARHQLGAGPARRSGGGVRMSRHSDAWNRALRNIEAGSPAKRGVRTL
jgi:chemotaxis signal transduction protein